MGLASSGELGPVPQGETIGHDLDALILPGDINVENLKARVAPASRQTPAAARCRGPPLARRTPDRCEVVPEAVVQLLAATARRSQVQGQAEPAEEQHAEEWQEDGTAQTRSVWWRGVRAQLQVQQSKAWGTKPVVDGTVAARINYVRS